MNEMKRKEHIDRLLDKMAEKGLDSLTYNERHFMKDTDMEEPLPDDSLVIDSGHGDIVTDSGIISIKVSNNLFDNVDALNSIFEMPDDHSTIDNILGFLNEHHGNEFTYHQQDITYLDTEHAVTELLIYKENYPNPCVVINTHNDPDDYFVTMDVHYKLFHQIKAAFPNESDLVYQTAFEEWIIDIFDEEIDEFGTFSGDPRI